MTRHFQLIFETGIDRHFDSDIISDIKKILELRHEAIKDVHCLSQMKRPHQSLFKRSTFLKTRMETLLPGSYCLIAQLDQKLNAGNQKTYTKARTFSINS